MNQQLVIWILSLVPIYLRKVGAHSRIGSHFLTTLDALDEKKKSIIKAKEMQCHKV